jgi:hypothetical protein
MTQRRRSVAETDRARHARSRRYACSASSTRTASRPCIKITMCGKQPELVCWLEASRRPVMHNDRLAAWENAHDVSPAPYFLIQALLGLLFHTCLQISRGKAVNARMSWQALIQMRAGMPAVEQSVEGRPERLRWPPQRRQEIGRVSAMGTEHAWVRGPGRAEVRACGRRRPVCR